MCGRVARSFVRRFREEASAMNALGVVRLDVGGGEVGGIAKIIKFRIAFFHAATSNTRRRVTSTRKREAGRPLNPRTVEPKDR